MHKFRKAIWHSIDLDKIDNSTRRSKEEAIKTDLKTDYNAPHSHGISCSCCRKLVNESTTHHTTEEKVSSKSPGRPRRSRSANGEIQINIKDTGTGLSSAILPMLFSKFVSTDSGGIGLGLFVSRNIVEAHGGKIQAQNNDDGIGAMFSITIPKVANSQIYHSKE